MRKPGPFSALASVRKFFIDNFNRPDSEDGLGVTERGSTWDIIRGSFRVLAERAYAPPGDEDFPIATVNMPYQDVTISTTAVQPGTGIALWVTDSGNWWGLGLEQEEVDCNCNTATDCNQWNQAGLCLRWNVGTCDRWNSGTCNRWTCSSWNSSNCRSWSGQNCRATGDTFICERWNATGNCASGRLTTRCISWNANTCSGGFNAQTCATNSCNRWNTRNCNRWNIRNCNLWTSETCSRWFEFTFDCQKCYPQWIRLFQSVNSTVTTMARFLITKTFTSQPSPQGGLTLFFQSEFVEKIITSLRVFTKGNEISADLFYDEFFQDKVDVEDEIVYNATGAQTNPSYGILVIPSQNDPNRFIGPIDIRQN